MYKCGTSWLLHILAAHPEVIAWREFDIIRASHKAGKLAKVESRYDRLASYLRLPPREKKGYSLVPRLTEGVVREVFCGRGWVPLMGAGGRAKADSLDWSASEQFIDDLMLLAEANLRGDRAPLHSPGNFSRELGFRNSRRKDLLFLLDSIKGLDDMSAVPVLFWEHLQMQCEEGTHIAVKSADQVMSLHKLQELAPGSRKLAIVRDGRDAAISAGHFGQLMRKMDSPWTPSDNQYMDRLEAWAVRANRLFEYANTNEIIIIRYEDLKRNFYEVCNRLFDQLGMPVQRDVLDEIHRKTDFTTVSGGRKPGESAENVVRKGIIGEWTEVLSESEATAAWKTAKKALQRFGYTRHGDYEDNIDVVL
jgi:hypothetical protein